MSLSPETVQQIADHTVANLAAMVRADQDDLKGIICLRLVEKAGKIESARSPEAYGYRVARNAVRDELRRKGADARLRCKLDEMGRRAREVQAAHAGAR